jgi:hypothetical protein
MGLLHSTFLFDYNLFYQRVSELLYELDKGNYLPVYMRAQESIRGTKTEEWILHDQGTTLEPSVLEIETDTALGESDRIGYCLLVILSTYLHRPSSSLGENWVILQRVLQMVRWGDVDSKLLIEGMPMEKLLKPELEIVQAPRKFTDPYWRWVIPDHARTAGWLPSGETRRLRHRLLAAKQLLEHFDFTLYPHIQVANPVVIQDYQRRFQTAYTNALALLSAAGETNRGIFIVIS